MIKELLKARYIARSFKQLSMQKIEIPISKRKMIFSLIGCIAFVAAGVLFIYTPGSFAGKTAFKTESMIMTVGVLSFLFFGLCGYFIAKKLLGKSSGLVIDDRGILDQSSGISGHFIPWEDITSIGKAKVFRQSFVTLVMRNPQDYINAEKRPGVRKALEMNFRSAGSPFCISANALDIKFNKLFTLLQEKHREKQQQLS